MKVTIVSCFDYYANRLSNVIEYYKRQGYDVDYIISDYNHYKKEYIKDCPYEAAQLVHVLSYKKNISIARIVSHIQFANKVNKIINKTKPDVVYVMLPPNSLAKKLAKKKRKYKLIFDVCDMWPESFPSTSVVLAPFMHIWRILRDNYLNRADRVLAVSKFTKNQLLEHHQAIDIRVMYPVVKQENIPSKEATKKNKLSFCYFGNVNHILDINLLLEFIKRIKKERMVEFHIVGGGQNLNELITGLKNIGADVIPYGITFDINVKKNIVKSVDYAINLPKEAINSSMSLKMLEYLMWGMPVINSGVGDNYEMVEKNKIGFNLTVENLDCVATQVITMSEDDYKSMEQNARNVYKESFVNQNYKVLLEL